MNADHPQILLLKKPWQNYNRIEIRNSQSDSSRGNLVGEMFNKLNWKPGRYNYFYLHLNSYFSTCDLIYTKNHEWIKRLNENSNIYQLGITHYAQRALGDVVYVETPKLGNQVTNDGIIDKHYNFELI